MMKSLYILFLAVATLTALVIAADSATPQNWSESEGLMASLRDGHKDGRGMMKSCDKYPRVCHVKGSEGPDCCHKKCVNVSTDRNNCGHCGKRCKYSQVCCKGKCVNTMFDNHHCGRCANKCGKGDLCVQGLCSYA